MSKASEFFTRFIKCYCIFIGLIFNGICIFALILLTLKINQSGLSLQTYSKKVEEDLRVRYPSLYLITSPIFDGVRLLKSENQYFRTLDITQWKGVGASLTKSNLSTAYNKSIQNDSETLYVSDSQMLLNAFAFAKPGQAIAILPGDYNLTGQTVRLGNHGSLEKPIHVTSQSKGTVRVLLSGEGVLVNKPFWRFSDLHLIGDCSMHSQCEHAFHIVGKGHNTVLTNNVMQDFNAMIKVNGSNGYYPDNGQIINNTLFNTSARNTNNPVTPIDIMHANNWQVSSNFIYDIQKAVGNKVSYAAFFKGGSNSGVFENNLIICAANLPNKHSAIGLSFGGGGSPLRYRRDNSEVEHKNGIIRNNIVMHCANDVGIYINNAENSLIENNIIYNTSGIDIRFSKSDAMIRNNVISGRIKLRDNASAKTDNNLVIAKNFFTGADQLSKYFVAPDIGDFSWSKEKAETLGDLEGKVLHSDFCGVQPKTSYLGAYSGGNFCLEKLNISVKAMSNL